MENFEIQTEEQKTLQDLALRTIESIKKLPQPVVRVCGPLTTGGFGYEENAKRLRDAEKILESKGFTVFKFDASEAEIQGKNYPHADVMNYFHKPVLESGLIQEAYFLSGWNGSKGATWEHDFVEQSVAMEVRDFPEDWFTEIE